MEHMQKASIGTCVLHGPAQGPRAQGCCCNNALPADRMLNLSLHSFNIHWLRFMVACFEACIGWLRLLCSPGQYLLRRCRRDVSMHSTAAVRKGLEVSSKPLCDLSPTSTYHIGDVHEEQVHKHKQHCTDSEVEPVPDASFQPACLLHLLLCCCHHCMVWYLLAPAAAIMDGLAVPDWQSCCRGVLLLHHVVRDRRDKEVTAWR